MDKGIDFLIAFFSGRIDLSDTKLVLSIVIPIYNAEKYLEECLESVINQEVPFDEYEIICIDDGSTDNSNLILEKYNKQIDNLTVFHQNNSGVSVARNRGLELAKGTYIWFVDADDFISINAIELLLQIIREDLFDRVVFSYYTTFFTYKDYVDNSMVVNQLNARTTDGSVCTSVYKKQFLIYNCIMFREGIDAGEDNLFNYELNKMNGKQKTIDDALYFYRVNEYSVTKSSANEKMLRSHLRCAEIAKQYYDSESKKELKTVRFLHCELEYVMTLISRLTYERRKEYLQCILSGELLPFMGIKPVLISIYTNIHSMHLKIVCLLSKTKIFSWRIKLWSKIWNSKAKKKIEKKIKSVIKQ